VNFFLVVGRKKKRKTNGREGKRKKKSKQLGLEKGVESEVESRQYVEAYASFKEGARGLGHYP